MFYVNTKPVVEEDLSGVLIGVQGAYKFLYEFEIEWNKIMGQMMAAEAMLEAGIDPNNTSVFLTEAGEAVEGQEDAAAAKTPADGAADAVSKQDNFLVRFWKAIKEFIAKIFGKLGLIDKKTKAVMAARLKKAKDFWAQYGADITQVINTKHPIIKHGKNIKTVQQAGPFQGFPFSQLDNLPKEMVNIISGVVGTFDKQKYVFGFGKHSDKKYTKEIADEDKRALAARIRNACMDKENGKPLSQVLKDALYGTLNNDLSSTKQGADLVSEQILRIDPKHPQSYDKTTAEIESYLDSFSANLNTVKTAFDNLARNNEVADKQKSKDMVEGERCKAEVIKDFISIVANIKSITGGAMAARLKQAMVFATQLIGGGEVTEPAEGGEAQPAGA